MITAERFDGRIVLASEFRDKEYVKLIPGSSWADQDHVSPLNGSQGFWHLPLSWAAINQLHGVFGVTGNLQVGPELAAWWTNEVQVRVDPVLRLRGSIDAPGWGPDGLRPDQRVGVAFMLVGVNGVLGDDTGTGKTVMGSVAIDTALNVLEGKLELPGQPPATPGVHHPVLVVSPNRVKRHWRDRFNDWAPSRRVGIATGSSAQRRETILAAGAGELDVVVINWENLRNHSRLAPYGSVSLRHCEVCDPTSIKKHASCERCARDLNEVDWAIVLADEVHRAKDPKSKWTRALWQIAHGSPSLAYSWGATGTLIADACDDFWPVGHFIAPQEYPTKSKYVDRYALQTWNAFGGMDVIGIRPETRDEFFAFFDARFLRRPAAYSLAHVKEPQRVTRYVELTPKQKKLYKELADELIGRLDDGDTVLATNPLTQTARLNQVAASYLDKRPCDRCGGTGEKPGSHQAQPHPEPQYAQAYCYCGQPFDTPVHKTKCNVCGGHGHVFWPIKPSSKIDDLLEILGDLPANEQVVVFAVSRKLLELTSEVLTEKKIANSIIKGGVSEEMTEVIIREFRAGLQRVCLVVIDAAAEGTDGLQCARIGVFMQRHYSRLKNVQAEGRLKRDGQEGQVVFMEQRAEGTIEDDKDVILSEKSDRFEELVRDHDTLRRLLSIRP